jgi:hypothetical protein
VASNKFNRIFLPEGEHFDAGTVTGVGGLAVERGTESRIGTEVMNWILHIRVRHIDAEGGEAGHGTTANGPGSERYFSALSVVVCG